MKKSEVDCRIPTEIGKTSSLEVNSLMKKQAIINVANKQKAIRDSK